MLIKSANLRNTPCELKNARDYVPRFYLNEDYVFGSRTFSILHVKHGGKTFRYSSDTGLYLKRCGWLMTNYGLSSGSARIFLSRPKSQLLRIEEVIHGMIDSLLLFDTSIFIEDSGIKMIKGIIRLIIKTGTYNVGLVVKYWKSFCDFLYNRAAGFSPKLPIPGPMNFVYRALENHPLIQRIIAGDMDKSLCEKFAHLTSTRQMPSGDHKTEKIAVQSFLSNVEEPFQWKVQDEHELYLLSASLGKKCLSMGGITVYPHVSLSTAGSFYETVKDGGRGKEIREALVFYLSKRPEADEEIESPFGILRCPKDQPRWRHWCRKTPYTHYPEVNFSEVITEEIFAEQNLYYQGFDEVLGNQIVLVAFLEYQDWLKTGLPIPCRVLTVPEPGFKSRIVTTGPFWLNILQQGLAHVCKDYLKVHPSLRSSLQKTDQAWQSLYLMSGKQYPLDFACLSSDLKEATDHIPKRVGTTLLRGFINGTGIRSSLVKISLDLLEMPRTFFTDVRISESQHRGVMMGEPLTKVILSLLNLAVEESAMRTHLGISPFSYFKSPSWRSYHVGGDDHLAIGPISYLNKITDNHIRWGSKISAGKHGISKSLVKYCEKVLQISKIYGVWDVRTLNDSTLSYENSPFVDSIKVRLLSPTTKSFEVSSERNVAIGKGMSLGRTLKWLNKDHFPTKWVKMVRNRFFERMGSLLPDRSSGVFWQLMLPSYWGGLDMYFPDEIWELHKKVPQPTMSAMQLYLEDDPRGIEYQKLLRKFLSNHSYRGFVLNQDEVAAMRSHIETVIKQLPVYGWKALKAEFDPEGKYSAKELSDRIYSAGIFDEESIIDKLLRPILFKEILLGKVKPSPYNTVRLKIRYAQLWDLIYVGDHTLSLEEFKQALLQRPVGLYYKVGYPEEIHFASDRGYIYKSALDDALHGMPVLQVSRPFV
jgi:hypothetical protein